MVRIQLDGTAYEYDPDEVDYAADEHGLTFAEAVKRYGRPAEESEPQCGTEVRS